MDEHPLNGAGELVGPLPAGLEAREGALVAVEAHANVAWKAEALAALHRVACRCARLTSDDVWAAMTLASTHERRAMGAVMRQGEREGWIRPTSEFRPTVKASQHRQPIRIWCSQIYQPLEAGGASTQLSFLEAAR